MHHAIVQNYTGAKKHVENEKKNKNQGVKKRENKKNTKWKEQKQCEPRRG